MNKGDLISRSNFKKNILQAFDSKLNEHDAELMVEFLDYLDDEPTLDEKEIIRKPFERVVERLEELKNDCDCYGHLKKKGLVDWTIEIVKEECGISE